jgi:hypothetical protein
MFHFEFNLNQFLKLYKTVINLIAKKKIVEKPAL